MKLIELSKEQFENLNVIKEQTIGFVATEKKWFIDTEKNIIGIILLDNFDNDWSYVILGKESNGEYRAFDVKVSIDNKEKAERELKTSMNALLRDGKASELLYISDKTDKDEKSSIIITDINGEIKKYLNKNPEKIYDLSPRKFEELIASILEDFGFDVSLTQATRDGGKDIIASIRNSITDFLLYVECKKYAPENKVGVGVIREVMGVHHIYNPSKSIIVTSSFFSKDAKKEAIKFENTIDLKNYNDIKIWLNEYQ